MTRLGLGYSSISDRVLHDGDRDQKRKTNQLGMDVSSVASFFDAVFQVALGPVIVVSGAE